MVAEENAHALIATNRADHISICKTTLWSLSIAEHLLGRRSVWVAIKYSPGMRGNERLSRNEWVTITLCLVMFSR